MPADTQLASQLMERKDENRENIEDIRLLFGQLSQEWTEILEEHFPCSTDLSELGRFSGSADVYSLRRIIDNLASNTEKYASHSSPVSLTVCSRERQIYAHPEK